MGHDFLRQIEDRTQIDVHHLVPIIKRGVFDRAVHDDPGGVYQNIYLSIKFGRLGHKAIDLRGLRHIGQMRLYLAFEVRLITEAAKLTLIPANGNDNSPFRGETDRRRPANIAASTCNYSNFLFFMNIWIIGSPLE